MTGSSAQDMPGDARGGARPEAPRPRRVSNWAITAVVCSVFIFCPLLSLLGPLLAVKAIADIRTRPGLSGNGLAVTAIVIGLASIALWSGSAWWWHNAVRVPLLEGPREALMRGQLGDVDAFRSAFQSDAATLEPAVAGEFLTEMTARYGVLRDVLQDRFSTEGETADPGRLSPVVPYVLQFESGLVRAEAEFIVFAPGFTSPNVQSWELVAKWRSIVILDDDLGDLAYPPGTPRAAQQREAVSPGAGNEDSDDGHVG